MNIDIKVIPGARQNLVKKEGDIYKVYITARAVDGKANKALLEYLSEYFNVKKRQIQIIKGLKSRQKTISICDNLSQT